MNSPARPRVPAAWYALLVASILAAAGCGQTGPLVLPGSVEAPAGTDSNAPEEDEEEPEREH